MAFLVAGVATAAPLEAYKKVPSQDKAATEQAIAAAQAQVSQGDAAGAVRILRDALAAGASPSRVRMELGLALVRLQRVEQARFNLWFAAGDLPPADEQRTQAMLQAIDTELDARKSDTTFAARLQLYRDQEPEACLWALTPQCLQQHANRAVAVIGDPVRKQKILLQYAQVQCKAGRKDHARELLKQAIQLAGTLRSTNLGFNGEPPHPLEHQSKQLDGLRDVFRPAIECSAPDIADVAFNAALEIVSQISSVRYDTPEHEQDWQTRWLLSSAADAKHVSAIQRQFSKALERARNLPRKRFSSEAEVKADALGSLARTAFKYGDRETAGKLRDEARSWALKHAATTEQSRCHKISGLSSEAMWDDPEMGQAFSRQSLDMAPACADSILKAVANGLADTKTLRADDAIAYARMASPEGRAGILMGLGSTLMFHVRSFDQGETVLSSRRAAALRIYDEFEEATRNFSDAQLLSLLKGSYAVTVWMLGDQWRLGREMQAAQWKARMQKLRGKDFNPTDADFEVTRVEALADIGRFDEARQAVGSLPRESRGIGGPSFFDEAVGKLAEAAFRAGDLKRGFSLLRDLDQPLHLHADPFTGPFHSAVGKSRYREAIQLNFYRKDWRGGEESLVHAIAKDPASVGYLRNYLTWSVADDAATALAWIKLLERKS